MLQRQNKSLASAILELGEQMQMIEQLLRDFCQNYAQINNPQSEVGTRIDEFLTGNKVKVKSPMARSLPVENLLPQNVGSIINYLQ